MKKIFTILVAVLFTASAFAQAPKKMSYQAVIRDVNSALIKNTQIGMQINIRRDSTTGTIVYTETQTPTTNVNGLINIEIGGDEGFSTINWGTNTYYIETKTAVVAPLTTYTITGVSQLLSVPYALYAEKAESYAGWGYVQTIWAGNINGNNPIGLGYTTEKWKGGRKIMMNGYVRLEFIFPQDSLKYNLTGTANVNMYLKYNGQIIMPVCFMHIKIKRYAQITLPLIALIPNSIAGNSMQFSLEGESNGSYSDRFFNGTIDAPEAPIDVKATVFFTWVEL